MTQYHWIIEGYDSLKQIFRREVPTGNMSEPEMIALLKRLAAQHLTPDEIVDSSLRKNAKQYKPLLEEHIDMGKYTIMVGSNPHFTARVKPDA